MQMRENTDHNNLEHEQFLCSFYVDQSQKKRRRQLRRISAVICILFRQQWFDTSFGTAHKWAMQSSLNLNSTCKGICLNEIEVIYFKLFIKADLIM